MAPKKRVTVDADLSNAGDDFHILWAVQKSLELLNFNKEGLKTLALEGLVSKDKAYVDPDGDICLGVDLTEYYGGEHFNEANRVVVSQLKYSTRHPEMEWTAARICSGKNGTPAGSIIDRLATFFRQHLIKYDRKDVSDKVRLKLVSNRPASRQLIQALNDLKVHLNRSKTTYMKAKNKLSKTARRDIERIKDVSGLPGQHFIGFIKALDFSDCHADSRLDQHKNLLLQINRLGSSDADIQYKSLHHLVWSKMMPESTARNEIRLLDILYEFKLSELADLFPVQEKFETKKFLVERIQTTDIINQLKTSRDKVFCLHAGAGLGKSTLITQIRDRSDDQITFVLFDCYGGGTYLDSDDRRHKHQKAFTQLSNALASIVETPFLVRKGIDEEEAVQQFKRRIDLATKALRTRNPDATLCFIIDAGDNSAIAAERYKDHCFIHDLVNMNIPDGCKMLVTTRTARRNSLNLPGGTIDIILQPFSVKETKRLLKLHGHSLSDAQVKEVKEFKELTYSTPRVMSYILEMPGSLDFNLMGLKPSGKSLPDIFKLSIELAEKKIGSAVVSVFLTYLIGLPRPVPRQRLQEVAGLSQHLMADLTSDLWHGIIVENEKFLFRDEDFENFLREHCPMTQLEKNRVADVLLEQADNDEYASVHLGVALTEAGRFEVLQGIVINKTCMKLPTDPIRNKDVFVERTRLAMKNAVKTSSLNFLKLQIIAAEAIKTNQMLEGILRNNPELATAHGDIQTNQRLYFQAGNPAWFGRVHFRSAAIFSRESTTKPQAVEHMRKAEGWLNYRKGLPENEAKRFDVNSTDIAHGAEAVLRILGVRKCVKWLSRWRPYDFVYDVVEKLLNTLLETSSKTQVDQWLSQTTFNIDIRLMAIKVYFDHGLTLPFSTKISGKEFDHLVLRSHSGDGLNFKLKQAIVCYCEYALHHKLGYKLVQQWIGLVSIGIPSRPPDFYGRTFGGEPSDRSKIDLLLRIAVIRNRFEAIPLKVEDYYTPDLLTQLASKDYQKRNYGEDEKRMLDGIYGHCISIFQARGSFLFGLGTLDERLAELNAAIKSLMDDWEFQHRYRYKTKDMLIFLAHRLSDIAFFSKKADLPQIITDGFHREKVSNLSLYLALADRFSVSRLYDAHTTVLLGRAEAEIESAEQAASEIIELLTHASIIGSRLSRSLGKHFFDKMVLASGDVDLEVHEQIKAFNNILHSKEKLRMPVQARAYARYVQYCGARLSNWDHFPWYEGFEAVIKLDLPSSMALLCQWDQRSVHKYDTNIVDILFVALEQRYLDHLTIAALLELNQHYWEQPTRLIKLILDRFDEEHDHIGKTAFVKSWFHKLKLLSSPSTALFRDSYQYIQTKRFLDGSLVDEIKSYQKAHELIVTEPSTTFSGQSGSGMQLDVRYVQMCVGINPTDPGEIQGYFAKLHQLNEHGYVNCAFAFKVLRDSVSWSQRAAHLTALCDLNERITSYSDFEENLTETLKLWKEDSNVQEWKHENFPKVLRALFSFFTSYDYLAISSIEKLVTIFESSREILAQHIISIIPDRLDDLTSKILYSLVELTYEKLPQDERTVFLEWIVQRWHTIVKSDLDGFELSVGSFAPTNPHLMTARLLRYFFGHPEKQLRWKAGHAIRRMVEFNQMDVIRQLIGERNEPTCHQFSNSKIPYLWVSAHLYFWIALERASADFPERLAEFSETLIQELENEKLPHALIKHFVKAICLRLRSESLANFSVAENEVIDKTLRGRQEVVKQRHYKRSGLMRRDRKETQFEFDTLDTLPYWFGPLGDVFGISDADVALVADKYIHQYWGYTGNIHKDNGAFDDYYDQRKRYNRKGTSPEIEDLQRYYEFNSMFCAATELLDKIAIKNVAREHENYSDSFESWINDWGKAWQDLWLSDFRDPVPLIYRHLVKDREKDREWQYRIALNDFDEITGLPNGADALYRDFVVAYGTHSIHYGKDYEMAHVSSALVSIDTGPALMRMLQTMRSHEYYIPFEDDERKNVDGDSDERFTMHGWIREVKPFHFGKIDETDDLYNDVGKYRYVLCDAFLRWSDGIVSVDHRFVRKKTDSTLISKYEAWNNADRESRYDDFTSSGHRLLVKKSTLLKFLIAMNKCLVVACRISRSMEHVEFKEHLDESAVIYLIYPDGKISTHFRDDKLR